MMNSSGNRSYRSYRSSVRCVGKDFYYFSYGVERLNTRNSALQPTRYFSLVFASVCVIYCLEGRCAFISLVFSLPWMFFFHVPAFLREMAIHVCCIVPLLSWLKSNDFRFDLRFAGSKWLFCLFLCSTASKNDLLFELCFCCAMCYFVFFLSQMIPFSLYFLLPQKWRFFCFLSCCAIDEFISSLLFCLNWWFGFFFVFLLFWERFFVSKGMFGRVLRP